MKFDPCWTCGLHHKGAQHDCVRSLKAALLEQREQAKEQREQAKRKREGIVFTAIVWILTAFVFGAKFGKELF